MNDKTRHLRERFPNNNSTIDLLIAEDLEFLDLCEDYEACVNALLYWADSNAPEAKTRVNEYRTLIEQLETEILQALKA